MSNVKNGNTPVDYVWVTHHDIYDDSPYLDSVSDKPWDADYDAPVTRTHDNTRYRRADLEAPASLPMPPTPAQLMADPRVKALVEALNVIAERPTHEGGCYYNNRLSVFEARAALAQLKEPKE